MKVNEFWPEDEEDLESEAETAEVEERSWQVEPEWAGTRLDLALARKYDDLSRSRVQTLIDEGQVQVNGQKIKANYKLKAGDEVNLQVPAPRPLTVEPEPIPLEVVYEDQDVIVINKPRGLVVHPAVGHWTGTLVNALLWHCKDLSGINGQLRPGIVHRLDRDTSGLLMVAKNDWAHQQLALQIKERSVNRRYLALVHGNITEPAGIVDAPIGRDPKDRQRMAVNVKNGKPALTRYWVKERFGDYTLLECKLETGRTHQIRVHMAYLGFPVVGDPKYGPQKAHFGLEGQMLHAYLLGFKHPRTGEYLEFTAPLPAEMEDVLAQLRRRQA